MAAVGVAPRKSGWLPGNRLGPLRPWEKGRKVDLGLDVVERSGFAVLAVQGEVDVYTAPQFREQLIQLVDQGQRKIVVDLEGVEFLDSSGLGVLVGGLKRVRTHDGDLTLVCPQRRLLKLLEITGLTTVFSIYDSVDAAVSGNS